MRKVILIQLILIVSMVSSFGQWQTNGSKIYYNDGNIGIGVTDPTAKLDILGRCGSGDCRNFRVRYLGGGYLTDTEFSALTRISEIGGIGDSWTALYAKQGSASKAGFFDGDVTIYGKLGIGTTIPQAQLHIGKQEATPGTSGSIKRLSLHPYVHTGGPWNFICRDNQNSAYLDFYYGGNQAYTIHYSGKIGLGTSSPDHRLDVVGTIRAHEILVNTQKTADFVFEGNYQLKPLKEVEQFITENKHLPDISPADTMLQNGVNMGEFQIQLLQKIEELTLYAIEQEKERIKQNEQIEELKQQVDQLLRMTDKKIFSE